MATQTPLDRATDVVIAAFMHDVKVVCAEYEKKGLKVCDINDLCLDVLAFIETKSSKFDSAMTKLDGAYRKIGFEHSRHGFAVDMTFRMKQSLDKRPEAILINEEKQEYSMQLTDVYKAVNEIAAEPKTQKNLSYKIMRSIGVNRHISPTTMQDEVRGFLKERRSMGRGR